MMKCILPTGCNDIEYCNSHYVECPIKTNKFVWNDFQKFWLYIDFFGREWKVQPVTNVNIIMPFVISTVGVRK